MFCRVHLVENVCQRNHKKKKRHRSNDNEHASSAPGTAEPALRDFEISSPLVGIDHLQQHDLKVKRRKKPKSHCHNDGHSLADMFSSDISLNHKKEKRHRSNDNEHASSAPGTAEPALCDSEISSPLAGIDHLQQHDLKVKRRKKPKSHSHNDGHSLADMFSSDISLQHNEGNTARCYKEATNDDLLNLPQNVETFSAIESGTDIAMVHRPPSDLVEVQATDMSVNNPEHPMQPQTTLLADESVNNSSTAASLSPTESRVNDSSLVSDEQQVKLSHSAKRRRRRHRGRKLDHRNDEANVVKDEQDKNISTAVGSSLHNICASNFPAQVDHSSGVGRTHIIYDNVNSDEESDTKANAATHLNPDSCDVGSVKDQGVDYNTAVADGVVSNSFDTEIASQLQHENTVSGGFASSVKQASSATHIPHEPKMRRPAKNAQFANVQVYCRQRIKKSSATFMPCDQTADTVISPLPEQASIVNHF